MLNVESVIEILSGLSYIWKSILSENLCELYARILCLTNHDWKVFTHHYVHIITYIYIIHTCYIVSRYVLYGGVL